MQVEIRIVLTRQDNGDFTSTTYIKDQQDNESALHYGAPHKEQTAAVGEALNFLTEVNRPEVLPGWPK